MTEDEAKTKWCPKIDRHYDYEYDDVTGIEIKRLGLSESCTCIGSECVWWRKKDMSRPPLIWGGMQSNGGRQPKNSTIRFHPVMIITRDWSCTESGRKYTDQINRLWKQGRKVIVDWQVSHEPRERSPASILPRYWVN